MLACDSGLHRFTASTDSFARHFRTEAYSQSRDLSVYRTMYTEGEPRENTRKSDSVSPSNTSSAPQVASHGCEAPPQLSPEVLPPVSAAHSPARQAYGQSKAPLPSQAGTAAATTTTPLSSPSQYSDGKLEQPQQHHHHHHHHQQASTDGVEIHHERGHNSDSDSSSNNGGTEGNRRYREFVPDNQKDDTYWEKRRKNNEAARKSREKRRMHDYVLEGRITCLEDDNSKLRRELMVLKKKFNLPEGQPIYDTDMEVKESHASGVINNTPPSSTNINRAPQLNSPVNGNNKTSSNIPYSSPPPLLTVGESLPMEIAMYPGMPNSGLPMFLSETSCMNPDRSLKTQPSSVMTGYRHHQHLHSGQNLHHAGMVKEELMEEGEIRARERSNSNIERRSTYRLDPSEVALIRRASIGNYSQYRAPLSPSIPQGNQHPYISTHSTRAHYLHHSSYEDNQLSVWSQHSPLSSHSSDDNYDEPLQLTVRRDSSVSRHSHIDDSSREYDSNAANGEKSVISVSPPASSLPLKLRHKLPSHDASFPKDVIPNMSPASLAVTPQSFPTHPFINGMPHLPDLTLSQGSPLSLVKMEGSNSYLHRKEIRGSRRNTGEPKYLDPKYLERRRRNNEAARKCRENRKTLTKIREAKSDYLESENSKLRDELNSLQEEMKQLRELIEKKRLEQGIKEEPNVES